MYQALSIRQLKDFLIQNKYAVYQNDLAKSLYNPYDELYNELRKMRGSGIVDAYIEAYKNFPDDHKYKTCPQYHCMRTAYQYHKLSDTTRCAAKCKKEINLKYDHFKNRILTKKSLIKEHIWYNIKNEESITISGQYTIIIVETETKYFPTKPRSLLLNNIPVSYINITKKNLHLDHKYHCKLLYFCFDISSYCDVIDCILKQFKFLPLDIVKYILYLTSI